MLRSGIRKEVHPVEKKGKFVQNEIENTEGNGIAEWIVEWVRKKEGGSG